MMLLDSQRKLNKFILWIYLTLVWTTFIVEYYLDWQTIGYADVVAIVLIVIMAIVMAVVSSFLINLISGMPEVTPPSLSSAIRIISIVIIFLLTLAYFYIWYKAFYPGGFTTDSFNQLNQALSGQYNDWHPVWHTLVAFTLPLKLSGGDIGSLALFQIFFASVSLTYLVYTILEFGGFRIAVISWLVIVLNPLVGGITVILWKDVTFAYCGAIAFTSIIRVILSKNVVDHSIYHYIFIGVVLGNTTLFRHNACLFTVFLAASMILFVPKKDFIVTVTSMVVFILIVVVGVYNIIGVPDYKAPKIETLGLPLTIIGNVVVESPEELDTEMEEYVYSIAPKEEWDKYYVMGNFNSLKFHGINTDVIEQSPVTKTLKICMKCLVKAPVASMRALFTLTDIVYGTETTKTLFWPTVGANSLGIEAERDPKLFPVLQSYCKLVCDTFMKYITVVGAYIVAIIASILGRMNLSNPFNWKRIAPCLSILVYDFGTMLLLTGLDSRFFFITFLICPLTILLMLSPVRYVGKNSEGNQ